MTVWLSRAPSILPGGRRCCSARRKARRNRAMSEAGFQLSRRQALRTIAGTGALLSAGLWPGALKAADAKGGESAFRFVVANDLHYFDDKCGPFFEQVAKQIKQTPGGKPDFILLGGDLSDWA